jgi:predicted O-methyltransferase YrrM
LPGLLAAENRISRFHDEKGNLVDFAGMPYAIPAIASAAAKRLFGHRPKVPMISYRARRQIEHILSRDSRMVEFGSGNSTRWFASRVSFLLSVEDLPDWYEHVTRQLKERRIANVKHVLRSAETYADLSDVEDGSLHFALVDGTDREGCVRAVVPKLKSGGWLYLDNTDKDMTFPDGDLRRAETALREAVSLRGGSLRCFSDFSPTNFFVEQGMLARL